MIIVTDSIRLNSLKQKCPDRVPPGCVKRSTAIFENNVRTAYSIIIIIVIIFNLHTAAFKAYCAIWVRRSNFRHQASPRVSPRERGGR